MRQYKNILILFLACFLISYCPINAFAANLTTEEATYELLKNNVVKIQLDPKENFEEYINIVGMNYSAFDGYKHTLKYYYYKNRPQEYYVHAMIAPNESNVRASVEGKINLLRQKALQHGEPIDQINFINRYLIEHVDYDDQSFRDYLAGKETKSLAPWSAEGAILNGTAVCEGYAGAFLLACDALGIPCIKVNGVLQGTAHSWNSVYIASINDWLNVDVTNNDPGHIKVDESFYTRLFLLTDNQFKQYGYQWDFNRSRALKDIRFPYLVVRQLDYLRSLNLIVGRGGGNFATDSPLTRQELAALLVRLHQGTAEEAPDTANLKDVDLWARNSVYWCQQKKLMVGFPDGSFHGNEAVSKQQMAAIVLRLNDKAAGTYKWETVEKKAVELGLMSSGRTSHIHSKVAKRADVFDMLYRTLKSKDKNGVLLEKRFI